MNPVPVSSSLKYRPDIDGLRAVAVLSVVFYHLGLPLHGGFVGVDVFFTISGFLIGSILLRQMADRTFTYSGFYERRIRRIFPAMLVMMLFTAVAAYRYLFPVELTTYAHSLIAAALSLSNFYFWSTSGYFDADALTKPLLHTWSLAVEEQFYIALPIILWLLRRYAPKRIELALYLVALTSFVLSVYGVSHFPTATFYLLHTRAWELLLGTMLAFKSFPRIERPISRHVAGIVGLLLILGSTLLLHTWSPFPGLAAVPPCLGAALIIAAGRSGPNLVGRLLSMKPVVFVGLISYSLYLWHWPVIVFPSFGLTLIHGLTHHQGQLFLFTLSMIMATLSWRFVETPFRVGGGLQFQRNTLFAGAAISVVVLLVVGTTFTRGIPGRFSPDAIGVAQYIDNDPEGGTNQYRIGSCFIVKETSTLRDFPVQECMPDRPGVEKILVLGDSHAAAMWWGLNETLSDVNVMQATASGCKPVLHQRPRQHAVCAAIMTYALTQYLPTHHVGAVLIDAHWDDGDLQSVGETVRWLREQNIPVILFGPIVQYDCSLPRILALSLSQHDIGTPILHRPPSVAALDREMEKEAATDWHVPYVSMFKLLCEKNNQCLEYAAPGIPLLSDYGHLTKRGSVLVGQRIRDLGVLPLSAANSKIEPTGYQVAPRS